MRMFEVSFTDQTGEVVQAEESLPADKDGWWEVTRIIIVGEGLEKREQKRKVLINLANVTFIEEL